MSAIHLPQLLVKPSHRVHSLLVTAARSRNTQHVALDMEDGWTLKAMEVFSGETKERRWTTHPACMDPTGLLAELFAEHEAMLWALNPPTVFDAVLSTEVGALPQAAQAGPDGLWRMRIQYMRRPDAHLIGWPTRPEVSR